MKHSSLITGGAGFIGSHLVDYLIAKGEYAVVVDKLTYAGNISNLKDAGESGNSVFIKEDISSTEIIYTLLNDYKIQTIYHLAAESHVDNSIQDFHPFIQTNISGTHSMLLAGLNYWEKRKKFKNFRFIHISTDEVFGQLTEEEPPFTEESPYSPNSPYAASKAAGDHLVRAWFQTYGFPVIVTHSTNNYGTRQHREKFIPSIIYNALRGNSIPVYGNGRNIRDWIYVKDHCKGLYLTAQKGCPGEGYCFGANNERRNIDLANYICNILDVSAPIKDKNKSYTDQIRLIQDRKGHDWRYAINPGKAKVDLGWQAAGCPDEKLRAVVSHYLDAFSKSK